jgi:hypothetical protein
MIKIIFICTLSIQLFSVNLEALRKEKVSYKENTEIKYKKMDKRINSRENRLIIVFKKKPGLDIDILEKKYFLVLEKCLADEVCIFNKNRDKNTYYDLDNIKLELPNIEEIKYYKRYQFKPY